MNTLPRSTRRSERTCPHCGGKRKLTALITEGQLVRRLLAHLELPTAPPSLAATRSPPEPMVAW